MKNNGLVLHCHTEFSAGDGAMSCKELIETAKERGYTSVTKTDHGLLIGDFDFLKAAKKADINGIVGVEAYCEESDSDIETRRHLILLAKDYIGYKAISKAVTESNKRLRYGFPRMNKEILNKWFGPDSKAHGHIYATSACVGGVLAKVFQKNEYLDKDIKKIKANKAEISVSKVLFEQLSEKAATLNEEYQAANEEYKKVLAISRTSTKSAEAKMRKNVGTDKAEESKKTYDDLISKIESAKSCLTELETKKNELSKKYSAIKKRVTTMNASIKKIGAYDDQIAELESKKSSDKEMEAEAENLVLWYENCFGKGNFFIEIQYHGLDSEYEIMPRLIFLANKLNIPMVCANDAHYANKEDVTLRAMLVANKRKINVDIEPADRELYIKTPEELNDMLLNITTQNNIDKMFANLQVIAENCHLELEYHEHYPKFKVPDGTSAEEYLKKLAYEGIEKRFPDRIGWDKDHEDRLAYEIDVINRMGYADYHLIVEDFLNYGRKLGKENDDGVGYSIGPGRGSAVGSLVCYLVGITALDPLKYNLFFERYLNVERISMPDIDSDFSKEVREKVIQYMRDTYGENAICGIATRTTMKPKAAIQMVGRVYYKGDEIIKKISDDIPLSPKVAFNMEDDDGIKLKDKLLAKYSDNAMAVDIINKAIRLEGYSTNYGQHAAALIVSDNSDVSDHIALMMGKNGWCTQCEKEDAESSAGLLKMDFLGLKTLDVITKTIRQIKKNKNISIDMEKDVPFEPEVFSNIYAKANTTAVFQFEGNGMKNMLSQFKPDSFEDIILLVAAYRPGPMQYLQEIIDVKHGRKQIKYIVPELAEILDGTYGKPVYQEQVMQICNKICGFTMGEADIVRKAMAKKHLEILTNEKDNFNGRFIEGLISHGASRSEAESFWTEILNFGSYAFNKSHAAAYALASYYTAWLKYHYTAEYMAAIIDMAPYEKIPNFIANAVENGITIKAPNINSVNVNMYGNGNEIFFSLNKIKGVVSAAEKISTELKNGRFSSFKNFVQRVDVQSNVMKSLIDAGTFDDFNPNRLALNIAFDQLSDITTAMKKDKQKIGEYTAKVEMDYDESNNAEVKVHNRNLNSLNSWNEKYSMHKSEFDSYVITNANEDQKNKLIKEKELLGVFITGHPLDVWEIPKETTKLNTLTGPKKFITITGVATDIEFKTAKNGNEYVQFKLDDKTDIINCMAFKDNCQKLKGVLSENGVLALKGNADVDEYRSDDENTVFKFIVNDTIRIKEKTGSIILFVNNIVDFYDLYETVKKDYESFDGFSLLVYDKSLGEMRKAEISVNKSILNDKRFKTQIGKD